MILEKTIEVGDFVRINKIYGKIVGFTDDESIVLSTQTGIFPHKLRREQCAVITREEHDFRVMQFRVANPLCSSQFFQIMQF